MLNTKILKLNKRLNLKEYLTHRSTRTKERTISAKAEYEVKVDFDVDALIKEKEKLEKEIEKLNITREMRNKEVKYLTRKEKDVLYREYVYNSAIEGLNDFIEGNYYTHEQFLEEMKKIEEECKNEI